MCCCAPKGHQRPHRGLCRVGAGLGAMPHRYDALRGLCGVLSLFSRRRTLGHNVCHVRHILPASAFSKHGKAAMRTGGALLGLWLFRAARTPSTLCELSTRAFRKARPSRGAQTFNFRDLVEGQKDTKCPLIHCIRNVWAKGNCTPFETQQEVSKQNCHLK